VVGAAPGAVIGLLFIRRAAKEDRMLRVELPGCWSTRSASATGSCRESGERYESLERAMQTVEVRQLRVSVWDNQLEDRAFAERRGFFERWHTLTMILNLGALDDRPYDAIIAQLQSEGFHFTSMAALGDTEEAQRKLYALNDTTDRETLGGDGSPAWASFEDFQQRVCQADWYKPAGQMVVIDTANGDWAAMSAISRFDDYAYNLHTGVDRRYRGRKLAQAVKVLALRYARDVLQVATVRTRHNSRNMLMIAIDCKLGYVQTPGTWLMEKNLVYDTPAAAALPA
jgi:RimJ/RimL family protein N-acetyltransferase